MSSACYLREHFGLRHTGHLHKSTAIPTTQLLNKNERIRKQSLLRETRGSSKTRILSLSARLCRGHTCPVDQPLHRPLLQGEGWWGTPGQAVAAQTLGCAEAPHWSLQLEPPPGNYLSAFFLPWRLDLVRLSKWIIPSYLPRNTILLLIKNFIISGPLTVRLGVDSQV